MRAILVAGLIGVFSQLIAFQLSAPRSRIDSAAASGRRPSPTQLGSAIQLSSDYLERSSGPTGMFTYEVDTSSGKAERGYNIVRHAGVMYALASLNRAHPDRRTADALSRAGTFLRTKYIGPESRSNGLAVWSRPLPAKSEADLGAAGLALAALTSLHQINPIAISASDLQGIGQFIVSLQKPNGGFFQGLNSEGTPIGDSQILYYPGEAALGLLSLYEVDRSRKWLTAAGVALSHLALSRANLKDIPPDHWAVIATAKFLPYYDPSVSPATKVELIEHAARISRSFVYDQIRSPNSALDGAFDPTGVVPAAATRLEALLAALEFLPDDNSGLRRQIEETVWRGVAFLLRAQITSGPYAGGLPGKIQTDFISAKQNRLVRDVRIDFVQHALCAWLGYQAYLQKHGPVPSGH